MSRCTPLLLLLVSGACLGYHFLESHHFQEALIDEILWPDLGEERSLEYPDHDRFRRAVNERTDPVDCCEQQKAMEFSCCGRFGMFKPSSELREFSRQCIKEIKINSMKSYCEANFKMFQFSDDEKNRREEEIICIRECIGKNFEVLDNDGNILQKEMTEYVMKKKVTDLSLWEENVAENMVAHCVELVNKTESHHIVNGQKVKCNSAALKFSQCLGRNLELHCKAEHRKTTPKCNNRHKALMREEARRNHPQV